MQAARDKGTSFKHVRNSISIAGNLPCAFSWGLQGYGLRCETRTREGTTLAGTDSSSAAWWEVSPPGLNQKTMENNRKFLMGFRGIRPNRSNIASTDKYKPVHKNFCLVGYFWQSWFPWWTAISLFCLFEISSQIVPAFLQPFHTANSSSPSHQLPPCFQTFPWLCLLISPSQAACYSHSIPSNSLGKKSA